MESLPEPSAIVSAVTWVEEIMLGSAATALATLAIAGVGALLLTGRIDIRRGASIVLGCFVLFGAAAITNGLMAGIRGSGLATSNEIAAETPPPLMSSAPSSGKPPA